MLCVRTVGMVRDHTTRRTLARLAVKNVGSERTGNIGSFLALKENGETYAIVLDQGERRTPRRRRHCVLYFLEDFETGLEISDHCVTFLFLKDPIPIPSNRLIESNDPPVVVRICLEEGFELLATVIEEQKESLRIWSGIRFLQVLDGAQSTSCYLLHLQQRVRM